MRVRPWGLACSSSTQDTRQEDVDEPKVGLVYSMKPHFKGQSHKQKTDMRLFFPSTSKYKDGGVTLLPGSGTVILSSTRTHGTLPPPVLARRVKTRPRMVKNKEKVGAK